MKVIKKSYGIILTLSILTLTLLIIGMSFLSKDNNKTFTKDGYIISYKSGNTDIYDFTEGVTYKYNVNGDLVFKDNKSNKVVAPLDNFIHYSDGDIAFLKNGVILNLDNVSDTVVPYYNISNKSLLEFNNDEFKIANINGDLNINKFIGRISENKYIISAKNITAKLSGNPDVIASKAKGNFFEITYAENGVVIISDGENTHTTTADKSYIYIGEDLVISLGDKNIYYQDEQKLSLNQMTIDGDENIEIVPPEEDEKAKLAKEEEEARKKLEEEQRRIQEQLAEIARQQRENALLEENNRTKKENERLENERKQLEEQLKQIEEEMKKLENDNKKLEEDNKKLEEDNKSLIEDKSNTEETPTSITKNPIFRVVKAEISANKIDLDIDITDEYKVIDGDLNVAVINMKSGQTVYRDVITDISELAKISTPAGTLAPKTNYIVSITGNYKTEEVNYNKQFFQRVFVTDELGINLNKDYTTNSEISMVVNLNNTILVKGFDLTVFDKDDNEIERKTIQVDNTKTNVIFENLNSNTEYNVILNNITYNNVTYSDTSDESEYRDGNYTINQKVKTLKNKPIVNEISAVVNKDKTKVKFDIGNVVDNDQAATGYRYYVYTYNNITGEAGSNPVMDPIEKKDATPFEIAIDGQNLKSGQSYRYMVVVEYNDNEKDVEYNTGFSNSFVAGALPSVTFEQDNDKTTFNKIDGTIKISDENCTVPMTGRSCDTRENELYVRYYETGSTTISYSSVKAEFDPTTLSYKFNATNLKENTDYMIEVYGSIDFKDGNGLQACTNEKYENNECIQIGESMSATTKSVVPITVNWGDEKTSKQEQVFSLGKNRLESTNNSNAEADEITNLTIKVHASNTEKIEDGKLIKTITKDNNIKELFFDNDFTISATDTFELDIDALKRMTNGLLTKYYIFEITDATDSAAINNIPVENNTYVFEINPDLRADDILADPIITTKITKSNDVDHRVTVTAEYDADNLKLLFPNANFALVLGACSLTTNECHDLTADSLEELTSIYIKDFTLKEGTDYNVKDNIKDANGNLTLYRGDKYKFRFYITVDDDKDNTIDYYYPGRINANYVESAAFTTDKKDETFLMNIVSSTEDSITYNYNISNYDKIIYKDASDENYSIYYELDGEEHKVPITKFNENNNFTISGLSNNSKYRIYYKRAKNKTGNSEVDVEIRNENKYTFDGFYNIDNHELKYILENNPTSNKITIKLLDTEDAREILNRISSFHIEVTNLEINKIVDNKYYSELKECDEGCLKYIDYHYSNVEEYANKNLRVNLYAYYDTGLIANSFSVGYDKIENPNTTEYGYLFQQYSNDEGQNKYLVIDDGNHLVESNKPQDIYHYTANSNALSLYRLIQNNKRYEYNSNIIKRTNINLSRLSDGYKVGTYTFNIKTLNRKNIDIDENSNNEFSFMTITPDITTTYDGIINGADIHINTSSITNKVLNRNFVKEDDKYYFYVELYDTNDNKLDTKSVEITPEGTTTFTFDNLDADTNYKYKVFAKLKNGQEYTQLNDKNACETSVCIPTDYSFKTLKGTDLFANLNSSYTSNSNEQKYTNRELKLDIELNNEITNVLKNYDLIVNLIENNSVVDTLTIENNDLENNKSVNFDITDYDAIYGANYFQIEMLAKTSNTTGEVNESIYKDYINLTELKTPSINVTKSANTEIEESNYIYTLEYNIAINDIDKVIKNGKYSLILLDPSGDAVKTVSDIDIITEDESEFRNIVFSTASEDPNYRVDLKPNKEYTLQIVFDTYRNNQTLRQEAIDKGAAIESYTNQNNTYNYSIYTSGIYGVSLGEVSLYGATNSIEMRFYSSSNLDKLTKISYYLTKEGQTNTISSGEYTIGADADKTFTVIEGSNNDKYFSLVLDKEDIILENRTKYLLTFQFYITDEFGEQQAISTNNNSKYVTIG